MAASLSLWRNARLVTLDDTRGWGIVDDGARTARTVGITDDADDVVAGLEEPGLLLQPLIAELLAVVGGDDHDGVAPLAETP